MAPYSSFGVMIRRYLHPFWSWNLHSKASQRKANFTSGSGKRVNHLFLSGLPTFIKKKKKTLHIHTSFSVLFSCVPPLLFHWVVFLCLIMDDCLCLSVSTLLLKGFKITANSSRTVLISCAGCGLFYSPRRSPHPPPQACSVPSLSPPSSSRVSLSLFVWIING